MYVHGQEVLLTAQLDEALLLVGELHILVLVPGVLVDGLLVGFAGDGVHLFLIVVHFEACLRPYQLAVEIVLAGGVVVAACQVHVAREQHVGAEGAADVDVGHVVEGGPLVAGYPVPFGVVGEGCVVVFPYDVLALVPVAGRKGGFVVAHLIPLEAVGILGGCLHDDVVVGVVGEPVLSQEGLVGVDRPHLGRVGGTAPSCGREHGDVCAHRGDALRAGGQGQSHCSQCCKNLFHSHLFF